MTTLSVIIPALNEARQIVATIQVAQRELAAIDYEIIVVDNGSEDSTVALASALGAAVLQLPDISIGALRNAGAAAANGEVLVFIDADVHLTSGWLDQLRNHDALFRPDGRLITGSRCRSPTPEHFLNKFWFARMADTGSQYINSGHLITNRKTFGVVGGFDAKLRTSEDVDFCLRASDLGIALIADTELIALHQQYPRSLRDFIGREIWHGRSDFSSWSRFTQSKVALIATALVLTLFTGLLLSLWWQSFWPVLTTMLMIASAILAMTQRKFGPAPIGTTLGSAGLLTLYLLSRFGALFLSGRRVHRAEPVRPT